MMKGTVLILGITLLALTPGCGGGSASVQPPPTLPTLSAAPGSIAFGNVTEGTTSPEQPLTLTASSAGSVTITSISGLSQTPFNLTGFTTPVTLSPSQSVVGNVTFAPATTGNVTTVISVTSSASNSPTNVSLSGAGVLTGTTLTPSSSGIDFGSVVEGTTSPAKQLTLTAGNSGSVTISSITIQSPFNLTGISPPLTLSPNQSVTGLITFAPATAGSATFLMNVSSNASNSPNNITLSGVGISSTPSLCTGTPLTQTQADVTAALNAVSGLTVNQLTSNGSNWNTYADIPAYSSTANVVAYNYEAANGSVEVATSYLDGTHAQVISGNAQGTQVQVTGDGKFAYYEGQNSNQTADIYAVPISQSGSCVQNRLSTLSLTPIAPAQALIISTASKDQTGHNVIAFSEGIVLHRVRDDGTTLPDLTLPDPESANVFHRMRLNPVFPNIMWYKRDAPAPNPNGDALQEIWVVDLNNPGIVYSLSGSTGPSSPAIDHASWSNNGSKLGYIKGGVWWVANVLNPDGTFNFGPGNTFTQTSIGPPAASGLSVDFCNLAPDSSLYVCAQSYRAIYLMSLDGTQTLVLANPNSSPTEAIYNGIPKPRFLDLQHIIFSSDRTGLPQVYVMSGIPTTF